jgi:Uma2 family endonuclease
MVAQPQLSMMTPDPDDFDRFALLPENRDRLFEFIAGEIVEVVSNPLSSNIAAIMSAFISIFVIQHNLGHVTGADGGYMLGRERYIPDVGFISYKRQRVLASDDGYNPLAPDLAVEVLSPGNLEVDMEIKIANYLAGGTVVWRVKPIEQQIAVFVPGAPVKIFGIDDILDGGEVLPGFSLPLKEIFRTPPAY